MDRGPHFRFLRIEKISFHRKVIPPQTQRMPEKAGSGGTLIYMSIYIWFQSDIKSVKIATDLNFFLIKSLYLPHDRKNMQKNLAIFFGTPNREKLILTYIWTGSVL